MLASWVYKNEPTMTSGCSGCGAGRDCALRPLPAAADRTTGRCLASAAGGTYSSESSSAGAPVGAARRFEGGRAAAAAAAFSATTAVIVMVTGTTGSMAGAAAASQAASFALTGATTSWNCGPIWVQACARRALNVVSIQSLKSRLVFPLIVVRHARLWPRAGWS